MTLWLFQTLPPSSSNFSGYSCAKLHRERPRYPSLGNGLSWLHFSKWPILVNYYLVSLRWWLHQPSCPSSGSWPYGTINQRHLSTGQSGKLVILLYFAGEPQHTVPQKVTSFSCSEIAHCTKFFAVGYFRAHHFSFINVCFILFNVCNFWV